MGNLEAVTPHTRSQRSGPAERSSSGVALIGSAIIFDRASQAFGRRLQKHSEVFHG
ncbi:hypothetical protein AB395_00001886 [Sinorhizobium fredii CCBAU 45436]|nr:hypothetical protein AB395_00001886 [Sinorhizobium fredii CCBAU 45436]